MDIKAESLWVELDVKTSVHHRESHAYNQHHERLIGTAKLFSESPPHSLGKCDVAIDAFDMEIYVQHPQPSQDDISDQYVFDTICDLLNVSTRFVILRRWL